MSIETEMFLSYQICPQIEILTAENHRVERMINMRLNNELLVPFVLYRRMYFCYI